MRRRPDFYTRPPEERVELERKRDESWRLRKLRQLGGKKYLPDGEIVKAMNVFGVQWRRVYDILTEHLQYEEEFCNINGDDFDTCSASYFIKVRGRNKDPELSDTEKDAIILGIIDRSREAIYGSGEIVPVKLLAGINRLDVFNYAKSICSTLTYHSTRRFIDLLLSGDTVAELLYAAYGKRWVKEHLAPKKSNIPADIDDWWIFDDYHLGFYINYRGVACRAILLWGIEPKSKYIVGFRVVPKIRVGIDSQIKGASYTKEDYGILVATSMVRAKRRPLKFYNDNAKAFTALDDLLSLLPNLHEEPMGMAKSIPGEPWGRGVLENRNGELRDFIAQYYGLADRDFNGKDAAAQAAIDKLRTDEQLTVEFEKYRNQINIEHLQDKRAKDGLRPSRADRWGTTIPRPAPPIRRLVILPYPELDFIHIPPAMPRRRGRPSGGRATPSG